MSLVGDLDRLRARTLHRVLVALGRVDPLNLHGTWPPAALAILDTVLAGQDEAAGLVERSTAATLTSAIGLDLGWDLTGLATGRLSRETFAARLARTPDLAARRIAAGATPVEAFAPSASWATQVAGSVVHDTARNGTAQIATSHPGFSGWWWDAEPGACAWCRMQESRGAVFHEKTSKRSHGHCKCTMREVTDRAEASRLREDGKAAWERQLATGDVPAKQRAQGMPKARKDGGPAPTSPTRPGARTPQRAVAIDAQIASYERTLPTLDPASPGAQWQRNKLAELRAERAAI